MLIFLPSSHQISAVAINRNVDCSKWREEAAAALEVAPENVFCEITRLPFDPNANRPPGGIAVVPRDTGGGSKKELGLAAIIGIAAASGLCCCLPFGFLLWRRRKRKEKEDKYGDKGRKEGEQEEEEKEKTSDHSTPPGTQISRAAGSVAAASGVVLVASKSRQAKEAGLRQSQEASRSSLGPMLDQEVIKRCGTC